MEFFPYPSGSGLTVGHLRNYVPSDVIARLRRRQGYAVLHPMGWDAFGLPAENEARLTGRHPAVSTREYAANYRRQLELVSGSYDWSRELFSSDPSYYRWTQWIFLLLHQRGLIYRAEVEQWWCDECATVLANEQVTEGASDPEAAGGTPEIVCWRGHGSVHKRPVRQWFCRITAYAERLLDDLDELDWPEGIKAMQRHWIGGQQLTADAGSLANSAPLAGAPAAAKPGSPEGGGYRLRDWSVSRQRFWGAPIPLVHCPACGTVPVPSHQLPVRLPEVDVIPPSGVDPDGYPTSPLANIPSFVATVCPACGHAARRETDTLDGFACSSWYFLRFTSPDDENEPFDPEAAARWMPVDLYVGGAEHAVMHLLYARFWTKVLFDAGLSPVSEPFRRLVNQGMILDATGAKMSKSRKAFVVTPDEAVSTYGADAVRAYICFIAPFDQDVMWQSRGLVGVSRWLRRVWRLALPSAAQAGRLNSSLPHGDSPSAAAMPEGPLEPERASDPHLRRAMHRAVRDFSAELEAHKFNTAVAKLMGFTGELEAMANDRPSPAWQEAVDTLLLLAAPIVPHIAEELWHRRGKPYSIHQQPWPEAEARWLQVEEIELPVQLDGKVRTRITVPAGANDDAVRAAALAALARWLEGREPREVRVVAGRLVSVTLR